MSSQSVKRKSEEGREEEEVYGILEKRNIKQVQFGLDKRFPTWYGSNVYFGKDKKTLAYKESNSDHSNIRNSPVEKDSEFWLDTLYVCEFCFKYTDDEEELIIHTHSCTFKDKSPGRIKYKSPEYTIRRIKGSKHELFCQCLCLFTKLFLDNKSVYFKIKHYEFYIIYKTGSTIPMGFFSRDCFSYNKNNLACILVFPPYQRRNLGTMLIDFSYRLSLYQEIASGPELPLSPFGLIGYLKYWSFSIAWHFNEGELRGFASITLTDISTVTGMRISDIITTLEYMGWISKDNEILLSSIRSWTRHHPISQGFMINDEYLLIDD